MKTRREVLVNLAETCQGGQSTICSKQWVDQALIDLKEIEDAERLTELEINNVIEAIYKKHNRLIPDWCKAYEGDRILNEKEFLTELACAIHEAIKNKDGFEKNYFQS